MEASPSKKKVPPWNPPNLAGRTPNPSTTRRSPTQDAQPANRKTRGATARKAKNAKPPTEVTHAEPEHTLQWHDEPHRVRY